MHQDVIYKNTKKQKFLEGWDFVQGWDFAGCWNKTIPLESQYIDIYI